MVKTLGKILAVAMLVTAMAGMATTALAADKVVKIGVLGPFTGPAAKTGEEFKASLNMAFDKIDWKIGDYKIEPVWIDSQSDPAKATNAYAEAAEKSGIQAGVLNWHSSVAVAAMDVAAQYKVPHFFGFGATEVVNEKYHSDPEAYSYWVGKGWPVPAYLEANYIEFVENMTKSGKIKLRNKKVAVYAEDSDWGRSAAGALKEYFAKAGYDIVAEDYFPLTQSDFYPLLGKYRSLDASIVAGTSTVGPTMTAFIKQFSEVQVNALLIADGLGWFGDFYKLTGKTSNYVLDMIPQFTSKAAQEWAKTVKEKYGFTPSPSAGGLSYDGVSFFIKVLQRTFEKHGKLDKEAIYEVYMNEVREGKLTYTAADGAIIMKEYKYTKETAPDPVLGGDYYYFPVIQYMDGKGYIVYPEDWKTGDFKTK